MPKDSWKIEITGPNGQKTVEMVGSPTAILDYLRGILKSRRDHYELRVVHPVAVEITATRITSSRG